MLLSCHVRVSEWIHTRIPLLSLKLQIWSLLQARSSLTFRQTIECVFTLKVARDRIITCSQMHHTDKYIPHSSIILPVLLNGWVFVYELNGCRLKSPCCHLNLLLFSIFKKCICITVNSLLKSIVNKNRFNIYASNEN